MNRSKHIQQELGRLRGGELVDVKFIQHNGKEVASITLFQEEGQLKVREIAAILQEKIIFQTRNISWKTARNLLNAYFRQPKKER